MFKKILLCLAVALTPALAFADDYTHDATVLPQAARDVIHNNFDAAISVVKIDKDFGRVSEYEVVLTDGSEIQFDNKGNWKDIEAARGKTVPGSFVPNAIQTYVANNQKGAKVVGIERSRGGYEIELSNGIEMKFDKNGNFKRYD